MKSILISIKPKWVADILNGRKTIEIRKTMPKCDLPIDVYIYCSKGGKKDWHLIEVVDTDTGWEGYEYDYYIGSKGYLDWCFEGKVVAKFTLNKVEKLEKRRLFDAPFLSEYIYKDNETCYSFEKKTQLTEEELCKYLKNRDGYAWHIDNLVIFDKPKELSEFRHYNKPSCESCPFIYSTACDYHKEVECDDIPLTKAPQSFMFIEVE